MGSEGVSDNREGQGGTPFSNVTHNITEFERLSLVWISQGAKDYDLKSVSPYRSLLAQVRALSSCILSLDTGAPQLGTVEFFLNSPFSEISPQRNVPNGNQRDEPLALVYFPNRNPSEGKDLGKIFTFLEPPNTPSTYDVFP